MAKLRKAKPYAKALAGAVCAGIAAAAGIYTNNAPLQIAAAALVPISVYLVPNKEPA